MLFDDAFVFICCDWLECRLLDIFYVHSILIFVKKVILDAKSEALILCTALVLHRCYLIALLA